MSRYDHDALTAIANDEPGRKADASIRAGWICIGVYVLLAWFIPFLSSLLLWPLLLAALVLGIVAASRGSTLHGVTLIIVACMTGPIGCVASMAWTMSGV